MDLKRRNRSKQNAGGREGEAVKGMIQMLGTSIMILRLLPSRMAGDNSNTNTIRVLELPPGLGMRQRK